MPRRCLVRPPGRTEAGLREPARSVTRPPPQEFYSPGGGRGAYFGGARATAKFITGGERVVGDIPSVGGKAEDQPFVEDGWDGVQLLSHALYYSREDLTYMRLTSSMP